MFDLYFDFSTEEWLRIPDPRVSSFTTNFGSGTDERKIDAIKQLDCCQLLQSLEQGVIETSLDNPYLELKEILRLNPKAK